MRLILRALFCCIWPLSAHAWAAANVQASAEYYELAVTSYRALDAANTCAIVISKRYCRECDVEDKVTALDFGDVTRLLKTALAHDDHNYLAHLLYAEIELRTSYQGEGDYDEPKLRESLMHVEIAIKYDEKHGARTEEQKLKKQIQEALGANK